MKDEVSRVCSMNGENANIILVGKAERKKKHSEDLGTDASIILKSILGK
jgi:hypothetical protein